MKEEPISSLFDVASFFSHMGYSNGRLHLEEFRGSKCLIGHKDTSCGAP
uniref:Uncharacterized protein n=1 Tax=Vitis vinifera TaxID=29760 RepID=F6HR08_VITVI